MITDEESESLLLTTQSDDESAALTSTSQNPLEDSDYSSDASLTPLTVQPTSELRHQGRRRRRPARQNQLDAPVTSFTVRDNVAPLIYSFPELHTKRDAVVDVNVGSPHADSEKMDWRNLRDLVKYSPSDLLTRAWHLTPSSVKTKEYPPFSSLPNGPDILEVRFANTNDVSQFMCKVALELSERYEQAEPVFLRSLLVQAAVHDETASVQQGVTPFYQIDEALLDPKWESDLKDDAEEEDDSVAVDSQVTAFDFSVALSSSSLNDKVPLYNLSLLHRIVNKCIRDQDLNLLRCWGALHIARTLLRQVHMEAQKDKTDLKWFSTAVSLIYKIAVGGGSVELLLSIFRWTFLFPVNSKELSVMGLKPLIESMGASDLGRIRLSIPSNMSKGQLTSFAHTLGCSSLQIRGFCTLDTNALSSCVLLTDSGAFKISLQPPFHVLSHNATFFTHSCHGVFVEDDSVVVIGDNGAPITVLNANTLVENKTSRYAPSLPPEDERAPFRAYFGNGESFTPFFLCGGPNTHFAYFVGTEVNGVVEPSSLLLPRTTDSMSVQFFMLPVMPSNHTSISVVSVMVGKNKWLSADVRLNPVNHTMTVAFEHGDDTVAEVEGPIQEEWILWSATMTSTNGAATWTVYKNGIQCDTKNQKNGLMMHPTQPVHLSVLAGTFSGYVACVQVWNRAQSSGELRTAAMNGQNIKRSPFLLCSFPLNEGVGCYLHSQQTGLEWKGVNVAWAAAPKALPVVSRTEEKLPWAPSGEFYVVTNDFEVAVIEPDLITWISKGGKIVEQGATKLHPSEKCFYNTTNGTFFVVSQEGMGIRGVAMDSPPSKYIKYLDTVTNGEVFCKNFVAQLHAGAPITEVHLAQYVLFKLNTLILSRANQNLPNRDIFSMLHFSEVSLSTVGRLLSLCEEIIGRATDGEEMSIFEQLLLCVSGRMLTQQVKTLERRCPGKVVPLVVQVHRFLQANTASTSRLLREAQEVFHALHTIVLADCVSHDYQLKLITESADLKDVQQLLVPSNLPQFVASAIQKDLKKPFMSFLNRLKEECIMEASVIFTNRQVNFDASAAMVTVVLQMLAQKEKCQWHLIAVALVSSLCRSIVKLFEQHFPAETPRRQYANLLRQTSVGVVLFPVVHYLYKMDFHSSIAEDALKVLNDTRNYLSVFLSEHVADMKKPVHFVEAHAVTTPPVISAPFKAKVNLQHAKRITLEMVSGDPKNPNLIDVFASLVDNQYKRSSVSLDSGTLSFDCGGQLTIYCDGSVVQPGFSISIHADVELTVEKSDWFRDVCSALSYTIVKVTHRNLLQLPLSHKTQPVARDSFLRGGLSAEAMKGAKLVPMPEDDALRVNHAELCSLAKNEPSVLSSFWNETYTSKRLPYQDRLAKVMRWSCCAFAWHCLRPDAEATVEMELAKGFEWLKKRSYLLLEAIQQGREAAIVDRARFLLVDLTPRFRVEAHLAEHQHTEEPVAWHSSSRNVSRGFSRGTRSMDRRSRVNLSSFRSGMETLDFSSAYPSGAGMSTKRAARSVAAVNIFSKALHHQSESIPSQIFDFLINGVAKTTEELVEDLGARTRHAVIQTAAFNRQKELCQSHLEDRTILASVLSTHLQYRNLLSESRNAETTGSQPAGSAKDGFDRHYTIHAAGCGLLCELELQKAACSFVQAALQALLKKLDNATNLPIVESIDMCAVLCHPWDAVDMSILRPNEIFRFLRRLLTTAFNLRLRTIRSHDSAAIFMESRGLFDLAHRCMIVPNLLLRASVDGVDLVSGEVQGLHVENINVVCCAQNHWKALTHDLSIRPQTEDCDLYANFGLPKVVNVLPEVQYFEITVDLSVHQKFGVSVGLSSASLPPTEAVHPDGVIMFSSDGFVSVPDGEPIRFSDCWSVGDVIGCGVFAPDNSVFFTRNGEFLGVAQNCTFSTLIPFVEVKALNSLVKVIVNFGEQQPFGFDIASLHSSCRHKYLTTAVVCDTVLITVDYLITMCFKNFASSEESAMVNRDAVSCLLESAASFLSESVLELTRLLNNVTADSSLSADERHVYLEPLVVTIARLLHCTTLVIACFQFDSVTPKTHAKILKLCAVTLTEAHNRSIKFRAAQCLSLINETIREDYLTEAVGTFQRVVSAEEIVHHLVELARANLIRSTEAPLATPKWVGNTTVVRGKGIFFGSAPLPSKGTSIVGFRIQRQNFHSQGSGTPLGGCYYLGLSHGQPHIPNMSSLITRRDVFVLQDTDDRDQVPHLLLRTQCIPHNNHRRIFGNDEAVWVELNAELGEIRFYRENMIVIGLAFANIGRVDDLYPVVFHFNDDASCELLPSPPAVGEPAQHWGEGLLRSVAINALQQLHLVPYFASVVSQVVHRAVSQLDRSWESCLIALAVLGGERSFLYCQHDTFGLVKVHSIANISEKAVVFLANDEERHLLIVSPQTLKPSFIQTPLYATGSPEADACASLLVSELYKSLCEASMVSPLMTKEAEVRAQIEQSWRESLESASTLDLVGVLSKAQARPEAETPPRSAVPEVLSVRQSSAEMVLTTSPVVVDRHLSTRSLFTPNPSIAVTTSQGCSTIRGNVLFDDAFTIAVAIHRKPTSDLMYVGLTSSTSAFPEQIEEIAYWEDSWPLCSCDSLRANSINCCVEPRMIFSEDAMLYTSGDILLMHVKRSEGTVGFSRVRKGKRVDFGLLFEGLSPQCAVRPFVACGPDTVIVFSLMDGRTFPARSALPVTHFSNPSREATHCSTCGARVYPPWYGGEDNTVLCRACFQSWQLPKSVFYERLSSSAPRIPRYLVSRRPPMELTVGSLVEFEENNVLTWSADQSVNVETDSVSCVSVNGDAFAMTESLPLYGGVRADVTLGCVAGVPGNPFGGLVPFTPLWKDGHHNRKTCALPGEALAFSSSVIPSFTKAQFSIELVETRSGGPVSLSSVFIGMTNLPDATSTVTRTDLERLCGNNSIWGTWCDTKEKIAPTGEIFVLVDSIHELLSVSSTLGGLYYNPFVITCNIAPEDDKTLRLVLFAHEAVRVTSHEGLTSSNEAVKLSAAPVAIGLVPENFGIPDANLFGGAVVLLDSIERTRQFSTVEWQFTPHAKTNNDGTLFHMDDTITLLQRGQTVSIFCQGILMATTTLSAEQVAQRHRLMLYLSTDGLTASFVPPPFGKTHLGRITSVHGPEVCIVECAAGRWGSQRYAMRRKDIRYCALEASACAPDALKEGTPIAFKTEGIQSVKRGTVTRITDNSITVSDSNDERASIVLARDQCFVLDNEGDCVARPVLYSPITPPTSSILRVFEVGKSKYSLESKCSYNGIIFDCETNDPIELIGMSVLSQTTGTHRVDIYFKKGSLKNCERDSRAWTMIYSGLVEMHAERFFQLLFPPIHIEAGSYFALYINTSHNCGVGFYCYEDGCQGKVGSELDSDGTITVFLGRKSESSTAFGDFSLSPRGFCGALMYKQSKGPRPPLIEGGKSVENFLSRMPSVNPEDVQKLVSRPLRTHTAPFVKFTLEVLSFSARLDAIELPVVLRMSDDGPSVGLRHCTLSLFFSPIEDAGSCASECRWRWAWNSRVQLVGPKTKARVQGLSLHLPRGQYNIVITAKNAFECFGEAETSLIEASDEAYLRHNSLIATRGFFGNVFAEADAPTTSGELYTMSTGVFLNQSNSASYNGIMFDLRSKQDITLEEIFCIAQTTADQITVQLFWKEGGMEGAETSSMQWKEVASKELQLVDRMPFSVGPLNIRMKANQTYAVFINTSSSCGVRFYNSSDGYVGDIGDEFESDGILSVFVGRKSESATPFSEMPIEPRAFRGKLMYRACETGPTESSGEAIFSYLRAFIVTRILAALSSYVETSVKPSTGHFSYEKLLATLAALVASPKKSITDMVGAENLLMTLLGSSSVAELKAGSVAIPLASDTHSTLSTLAEGDVALLTDTHAETSGNLIRLRTDPAADGMVAVCDACDPSGCFSVHSGRLLPVTRCWSCGCAYATTELCASTAAAHRPAAEDESRVICAIAEIFTRRYQMQTRDALTMAQRYVHAANADAILAQLAAAGLYEPVTPVAQVTEDASGALLFSIPAGTLLTEEDSDAKLPYTCPFFYSTTLAACASLMFELRADTIVTYFVTDLPFRFADVAAPVCYLLQLFLVTTDGHRESLVETPIWYFAHAHGNVVEVLSDAITPSTCTSTQVSGNVQLVLEIKKVAQPPASALLDTSLEYWTWESNQTETHLSSKAPVFLQGTFTPESWPRNKPRFCPFVAMSQGNERALFLEVHVVTQRHHSGLWDSANARVRTRKPFSVACGEVVTFGFSADGDFFVYDAHDVIRCRVREDELHTTHKDIRAKIGLVCVGQERVRALLCTPDNTLAQTAAAAAETPETPVVRPDGAYEPLWNTFDPERVNCSNNRLTAGCSSEIGGQAVLGTPMPLTGVSAFIVEITRRDCALGAVLGSGHFAGVAVSTFSESAPHFGDIKHLKDVLWVVQDVQDKDSMSNQAPIPPLEREGSKNELFCAGTKLLFVVDRDAGTISLARANESPRIIFHDVPDGVTLCPFVRLDHTASSATLSRFAYTAAYGLLYPPSLEKVILSQPVTPSLLRHFPLTMVRQLFPALQMIVDRLPSQHAAQLEECWGSLNVHSRFAYRLSRVVEAVVEVGGFSRRMLRCSPQLAQELLSDPAITSVVDSLITVPHHEVVAFPAKDAAGAGEQPSSIFFRLSAGYEFIGRVDGTEMMRLLFIDPVKGPVERTLHLIRVADPAFCAHLTNSVLPHPSVVHQVDVLEALNGIEAFGVIFDGWFDCTLATMSAELSVKDRKKIAAAIICSVEHWHLHDVPHGHVMPENVYIRVAHGNVIACSLWNAHYLHRRSAFASPTLREKGMRSIKDDRVSCGLLLRFLGLASPEEPQVSACVAALEEGASDIWEILRLSNAFQDARDNGAGTTFTLSTKSRLYGCTASYNGIMFDLVAKSSTVLVRKLSFYSDISNTSVVSLFTINTTFVGSESRPSAWRKIFEKEMDLSESVEHVVDGFEPITIPAGQRVGLFLHTTSGSGVLFYSESEGVRAGMAQVEEENSDIGITVGKKCEGTQPFTAIQNQKRLLKGSITYSLVMPSSAPRSHLVCHVENRSLPERRTFASSMEPVYVKYRSYGIRLQTLHNESLLMLQLDRLEWVPNAAIQCCSYQDDPEHLGQLEQCLLQRLRAYNSRFLLHRRLKSAPNANARPLFFYKVECNASFRLAEEAVANPLLQPKVWWVSEPITRTCTLSLWKANERCPVYASLTQKPLSLHQPPSNGKVMTNGKHVFVHVDEERGCLFLSPATILKRIKENLVDAPLRLLVCSLSTNAGDAPEPLSAYVGTPSNEHCVFASHCSAFLKSATAAISPTWANLDVLALCWRVDHERLRLRFQPAASLPSALQITELPRTAGQPHVQLDSTTVKDIASAKEMDLVGDSLAYFVESQCPSRGRSQPRMTLSALSTALAVNGNGVSQVLPGEEAKCMVMQPFFSSGMVHEVSLRLVCPRDEPIQLGLEHLSQTVPLNHPPYATFATVEEVCFGSDDMQEVYLHLRFDMRHKRGLVMSSSGTVFDALCGRNCPAELQLSFTLSAPGSSVEVLEWHSCDPDANSALSRDQIAKAVAKLSPKRVSVNVAHTVGGITRHSPRTSAPASRESEFNPRKQMGILIISYARILLEKALVAQKTARQVVQQRMHYLMSFTSLCASSAVTGILADELRSGSFNLVAQSCAYLLAPSAAQTPEGVETSVNVVAAAMNFEAFRAVLATDFGPALALMLLRTATVFTRSVRHTALRCVQALLSNRNYPLPTHELLSAHMAPLVGMMCGLCKRGRMQSPVVQIGVTMVADLMQRYKEARPSLMPPGNRPALPYYIVICARAAINAITHDPPLPLPGAMTQVPKTAHIINCTFEILPASPSRSIPCYAHFSEENRDPSASKTFEVTLKANRMGAVVLGWEINSSGDTNASSMESQPVSALGSDPLPSCGYLIEAATGKVFVCLGRKKEQPQLQVTAKAGDVLVVSCSYREQVIYLSLYRGHHKKLTTSFKLTSDETIALPFYYLQHKDDAILSTENLTEGRRRMSVAQMYADLQKSPDAVDAAPGQSYEFYMQLNLFCHAALTKEQIAILEAEEHSSAEATVTVPSHEIAGYPLVSNFINLNAFTESTSVDALRPYVQRLRIFDALMAMFSPLINLQRASELFDIFRVLINLCAKETEERIQSDVMAPFTNRQGRKARVTIHVMQLQPSATLGAFPTLMRSVFGQLYLQLHQAQIETFFASPMFTVKLAGFGSTDAGGPYRDVLSQLATEIMTPHPSKQFQINPLFIQCGRGGVSAVMPNPTFLSSSQTPLMLEFFGKLLASFFATDDLLAVEFPPLFWKLLLNESTSAKDLTTLDPDIVTQLSPEELMERTGEELEERFPGIEDTWRSLKAEHPMLALNENLPPPTREAAQLLSERIISGELGRFADAVEFIQQGFDQVIPLYTLQAFRWQKVELLTCGAQKVSFAAFKEECEVQLPSNEAAMFLEVLEQMTDEDRTLLLRFTTGQSRLPLKSHIKVHHSGADNSLPTSSTCFFTLRLPTYSSVEKMTERILYAVRQCKAIDTDGQPRENLIFDI